MTVKLLTEHHLEFLSLKRGCTGSSESTLAILSHILKSHVAAHFTRDVFYVRREVYLMKTAKVNAYIMHIFGKIELLSIHAT